MAETKKTTATKTVKSSETKAAAPKAAAPKKTTSTTAKAAPKAAAEKKTTTTKTAAAKKAPATTAEVKAAPSVVVEEVKPVAPKAAAPKKANGPMIKVTLVKSGAGRLPKQIKTLKALGLNKTNSFNVLPDNTAVRGMIFVVKHLVSVENVK